MSRNVVCRFLCVVDTEFVGCVSYELKMCV